MLNNKNVKNTAQVVSAAGRLGCWARVGRAAWAQGLGSSPYSQLGIGNYNANQGGVRQLGMGGVGLAAPNATNVNELNPALLYYTARTSFEAGYSGQYQTVKNATASGRSGSGTLGYLALAVPINKRWGAAVGLKPLSAVDYEANTIQRVVNDTSARVLKQFQGSGGVSEAYFAHGIHVSKSLNVGGSASYIFGTTDETAGTTVALSDGTTSGKVVNRQHTRYSDFAFRAGAHYRHSIGKDLNLNLAGVYTFRADINGKRTGTQERRDVNNAITSFTRADSVQGSSTVPALAQFGISLDNDKNWSVNLDVAQQQWGDFRSFGTASVAPLGNTLRVGLGGEFTPEPGSVEHYFRRVAYRAGIAVAQLPYRPDGKVLYDRSVSWGFAFPLPTATPLEATTFTLGFTYGMRGNTELVAGGTTSNVQETYIKGQLGVTLNNRWFIKRKLQ